MPEDVSKDVFLKRVRNAHADWAHALARTPAEGLSQPGFCGGWSAKDVIAHMTWYEREMVDMLQRKQFGGSDLWQLALDERNATIHAELAGTELIQAVAEAEAVHDQLIAGLMSLSEDDLNDPTAFPGMPLEWKPWQVLASNTYEHYEDHVAQTRQQLPGQDAE